MRLLAIRKSCVSLSALHVLRVLCGVQELHAAQMQAGQTEQASVEQTQAEVQRLKAELERQQRQTQQVCLNHPADVSFIRSCIMFVKVSRATRTHNRAWQAAMHSLNYYAAVQLCTCKVVLAAH